MVHREGEAAEQRGRRQHPLTRGAPVLPRAPAQPWAVPPGVQGVLGAPQLGGLGAVPPRGLASLRAAPAWLVSLRPLSPLPPRSGTFVSPHPGP